MNISCEKEGIVHFWNLPNNHLSLRPQFRADLLTAFMRRAGSSYGANRWIGIGKTTILRYLSQKDHKLRIDLLLTIIDALKDRHFTRGNVEQNVTWIGHPNSQGVINPKLPFTFNCREGARFLAAICNDGWISDNAYYSYHEQDLADSVKRDCMTVFGGNGETVTVGKKENDKYLAFPSVIRDVLIVLTNFKGVKSENNPSVPSFILGDLRLILGWIEQTIADEGCVQNYPKKYRREISWKRAFQSELSHYNLNIDEMRMLNEIGIDYGRHNAGTYITKNGIEKTTIQMRIAKRENLLKLRNLIKIPCKRKDNNFDNLANGFERYKERLKIKEAIAKICAKNGFVCSSDLKAEMNYKNINAACHWLRFYSDQGWLKCVQVTRPKIRGRVASRYVTARQRI